MPHMLPVPALQFSYPMAFFVLMKSSDSSLHARHFLEK
jgi:hypothetical protein